MVHVAEIPTQKFAHRSLVIPVQLCKWVFRYRCVHQFRTWTILKLVSRSGRISRDEILPAIKTAIGAIDSRTVDTHIAKLLKMGFMRELSKGHYQLSGFRHLMQGRKFYARTSTMFYPEYVKHFREYVAGTIIGYIIRSFERTLRRQRKGNPRKGNVKELATKWAGIQSFTSPTSFTAGAALQLIAQALKTSKSNAVKLKQMCIDCGILIAKKQFIPCKSRVPVKRTYLNEIRRAKSENPFDSENPFIITILNGQYCQQIHDALTCTLEFRKRRIAKK